MNVATSHQLVGRFKETSGGVRAAGLLSKHQIALIDIVEIVLDEIAERIPVLRAGVLNRSKQLCGQELWSALCYVGIRRAVGMCVAFLVKSGVLPLKLHVTKSGKGAKRYQLDAAQMPTTLHTGAAVG